MAVALNFNHDINASLQVGDEVYYCPVDTLGGFTTVDNENLSNTGIVHMGKCTSIDRDQNEIVVDIDSAALTGLVVGVFIMFGKSSQANLSSLLGYYAETTFVNNSPKKAELFAASTEFFESSK